MLGIDISQDAPTAITPYILQLLLIDRTTGSNIIWATDHYADLGAEYDPAAQITVASVTGAHEGMIQPRVKKIKERRWDRTKDKAEVFTPSWLCNEQNNRIDEAWFGRLNIFNYASAGGWVVQRSKVKFEPHGQRTWKNYVSERRMEAACGEAPYLVSRYDTTTGESIDPARRIGLLDRKLRVIAENVVNVDEWRLWAQIAYESIYGFEYQGDSLLLARKNLLTTYMEYSLAALGKEPSAGELAAIATVISWNIWQMDALTARPPLQALPTSFGQLPLFGEIELTTNRKCMIRDWCGKLNYEYMTLTS